MATPLHEFVSLLGISCKAESKAEEESQNTLLEASRSARLLELFDDRKDGENQIRCSFPSLSLDHETYTDCSQSESKDEMRGKAARLLSRTVSAKDSEDEEYMDLKLISNLMLENLYSAFAVLVDARILVYAKVLRSHSLSLEECNELRCDPNTGVKAVDYKLKTLLEIGGNLSADAVETKFLVQSSDQAKITTENESEQTIPIKMEVRFSDLHISRLDQSNETKLPVFFEASGTVTGTFNQSKLHSVKVNLDCDALLSSMIDQATSVVAAVVDLTNQSWANAVSRPSNGTVDDQLPTSDCTSKQASSEKRKAIPSPEPQMLAVVRPSEADLGSCSRYNKSIGRVDDKDCIKNSWKVANQCVEELDPLISLESASNMVDYVIGEIDDFISRPPIKKQRLV